ncbi:MAG: hypothetical protein LBQ86_06980 [Holophagales bacterium]|jgi:hypothetical protein|nr:hypothetical protein [Holophagales bacterium]
MKINPNVLPWSFITVCSFFILATLFHVVKTRWVKSAKKTAPKLSDAIRSFNEKLDGVGGAYVDLIKLGFISSPRIGNRAKDFRDYEQYEDFSISAKNPEIIESVRKIGKTYGQVSL